MNSRICRLCGHIGIKKSTIFDIGVQKFLKATNITLTSNGTEDVCISCSEKAELAGVFVESVKLAQINFINHINIVPKREREPPETVVPHQQESLTIRKIRVPIEEVNIPSAYPARVFKREMLSENEDDDEESLSTFDTEFTISHISNINQCNENKAPRLQQQTVNDFKCVYCKLSFDNFDHLVVHLKKCKTSKCKHCQKTFHDKEAHKRHLQTHQKKKSAENFADAICDYCGGIFKGGNALNNHIETVHKSVVRKGVSYTCTVCKNKLYTQLELITHLMKHKKEDKNSTRVCEHCSKICQNRKKYVNHVRSFHLQPRICDYCGKHFSSKQKILEHLHVHTRLKTFRCELCPNLLYAKQKSLISHRKKKHPHLYHK